MHERFGEDNRVSRRNVLKAPGENVYSTYTGGGYATLSGTSMACPHVSGAAGILRAEGYSDAGARSRLQDTAEDLGLSSD